jgi:ankyrin repeat protein
MLVTDENVQPISENVVCDPMSLLFEAKMENIVAFDAGEARRLQKQFTAEEAIQDDLRIALTIQSEEDASALNKDSLLEQDLLLAKKSLEEDAKAIKAQEEEDLRLANETQKQEEKLLDAVKEQLSKDADIAKQFHEDFVRNVHAVISRGDAKALNELIENGLDCSIRSSVGLQHTPLQLAVKFQHLEICKILLAKGADPDCTDLSGNTALHLATQKNKTVLMKLLLDNKAKVDVKNKLGQTALIFAAKGGYTEAVDLLLQRGAYIYHKDASNKMPLHFVPFLSRSLKSKLENMMGWSLLENARKGRGDTVMNLLDRGASVFLSDEHNRSALHYAAAGGHNLLVEHLMQRNADPNAVDIDRQSPLHKAAAANAAGVYHTLLRHGARPAADARGRMPADLCFSATHHDSLLQAEAACLKRDERAAVAGAGGKAGGESATKGSPPKKAE